MESNVKRFMNGFKILCRSKSEYEVWSDLMYLFASSIANPTIKGLGLTKIEVFDKIWKEREEEYLRIVNKYSKKEQKIMPQMYALLVNEFDKNMYQDLLGKMFMELGISSKNKGQFFTPYSLCKCMADITVEKKQIAKLVHTKGYANVYDCTCGAGATIIAMAERCSELFKKLEYRNHVYFVAQDVDMTVSNMCYIQLSLIGMAGYVVVEDSLINPEVKSLNDVWFTPMWFSDTWSARRLFHNQDILGREMAKANG